MQSSAIFAVDGSIVLAILDRRGNCVRWSCSVKNKTMRCLATVTQRGDSFQLGSTNHTHEPDASRGLTALVTKKAKEMAEKEPFTSATTLVERAQAATHREGNVGVVKVGNVARRTNRRRAALRPTDPKTMDFVLAHDALPNDFWRDDIEVNGRRHLIFSTDAQLTVLKRAKRWYMDGTFKCMRFPFVMLLTIHAFVRRADCSKQVPLVFALMTGRKATDYFAVLESIKMFAGNVAPQGVVIDFEKPLWKAVQRCFPGAIRTGCAFHWGQAIMSHVKKLGLKTQYTKDRATHAFIRQVLSLPFLPYEHIQPTFQNMMAFNTNERIGKLLRYMDRHWFSSSVWKVAEWCIFGQSVRTNNDVEGWHRRFIAKSGVGPAFYTLVQVLHQEAKDVEDQIHLVSELVLQRNQRLKYRTMQAEVFKAWDQYTNRDISSTGLLKKISVVYGHRVTESS